MSTKEDLQRKIRSLEDQLTTAKNSLNQILIDEFPFKVGDRVMRGYNKKEIFTVSFIGIKFDRPRAWAKKTLKSGELGKQEFEIWMPVKVETGEQK